MNPPGVIEKHVPFSVWRPRGLIFIVFRSRNYDKHRGGKSPLECKTKNPVYGGIDKTQGSKGTFAQKGLKKNSATRRIQKDPVLTPGMGFISDLVRPAPI